MIAGFATRLGPGTLRPDGIPGRWNLRRSIPADVEPCASAAAAALEDASWWRPGAGECPTGGLVVACDHGSFAPAARFARELRDRPAGVATGSIGPGDFLFALPSSTAAVLGLLFGLTDYQATVVGGEDVGLRGLRHALDMLALRRVSRLLFAVLSVGGAERSAVAWCLDPDNDSPRHAVRLGCHFQVDRGDTTIGAPFCPATSVFLEASEWLLRKPSASFHGAQGRGSIQLERKGQ